MSAQKGDAACHISKYAQSSGPGGIIKQKNFTRIESKKKNLYRGQNQKCHILQGVKSIIFIDKYKIVKLPCLLTFTVTMGDFEISG